MIRDAQILMINELVILWFINVSKKKKMGDKKNLNDQSKLFTCMNLISI